MILTFKYTPDQITQICDKEKAAFLKTIEEITQTPAEKATFQNATLRLDLSSAKFGNVVTPVMFLKYISEDAKVREAADKCETSVSQMFVDIFVNEGLFKVIKAAGENSKNLNAEQARLQEEYLSQFRRNGLELSAEKRKIYIEKKKKLVLLESEFNNNLAKEKDFLEVTKAQLDGVPESYIEGLEKTPQGTYKITLDYPHYYPFMDSAKDSSVRKALQFKFDSRGGVRNRTLLEEAIKLRSELAILLGYQTHSAFVLERRMASEPKKVQSFLKDLAAKLKAKGEENLKELLEEKRKEEGPSATKIYSWDWRYYVNQIKKNKYNLDPQEIKEYFPLEVTLKGMFEIYETLLGVKYIKDVNAEVWNEKVVKYKIERDGKPVAYFYMDLFPREGKYGHAAAFTLVSGHIKEDGTYEIPVSSIVANFNPGVNGKPALLNHGEVETLFHEFGHIMHQTLTKARFASFAGTSVKTDFVEAPSQMLENWVWEKEALQKLSGHYEDASKKLPDDLIEKMLKAKLLGVGLNYLRQIAFATLDLEFHLNDVVNTTEVYARAMSEILLIPIQEGTMPQASFGHLMGGYDSGYYGYLWAEVYAQDMYTRFEKEGLLNNKTGMDYAKWILEPGGSQDPYELIKGFLGREPNSDAFLKSIGL